MKRSLLALSLLLLAAPLTAQGNGVSLLSKVKKANTFYNDIWGYTAPNGDEYALVGTSSGTLFYNCTDPANPVEVGFISGPNSIWRDMKTYGHYAYIVTEGGGGVQIVDLSNPDNPQLVKTHGDNWWGNAHNIAMDEATGLAYVCGTNNGMRVLDCASNPTSPPLVATYNQDYVHDLHVQDGQAHLAEIYDGRYRLVNVNSLPGFPTKDSINTPGWFTHNTWANETNTLCVTTDESSGGHIALYNISNPNNIYKTDEFTVNANSIVHNAYIRDGRAYMSWYTEGFVCVDISDPNNMSLIGQYDTSSYSAGGGYHGAWGCYPFSPSGVVYISDMEEGFHVLQVEEKVIDLAHDQRIGNTEDENGPYDLTVDATALKPGESIASVFAWYRVDGGSWQVSTLSPTGNPDEYGGSIPGQDAPSIVEYYVVASDTANNQAWLPATTYAGSDTFRFAVGRIVQRYFNDFEGSGSDGWTHGAVSGSDDFQHGVPQGKTGTASRHLGSTWYDPASAYSGNKVWGNDLGASSDGAYNANANIWLESPNIDCSSATNTTLMFQRWLNVEGAPYDAARVLVNGNVVWQNPIGAGDIFHILDTSWRQQVFDISQYADGNGSVKIRFELETDGAWQMGGWNLDDVRVVSLQDVPSVDSISLSGDANGVVGGTLNYSFDSAPASAPYWLYYSIHLTGTTINGHSFDIGSPYFTGTTGTTSGAGTASWTSPPLPGYAAGRTIYVEVRADANGIVYDSNVVTTTIQ
ncbi:MAG: choice-of-anchor B family protein [Planctomycetota bacterium]|nr:MAG: choice-of-anchor B family protein [Planctomycetota bacterium]